MKQANLLRIGVIFSLLFGMLSLISVYVIDRSLAVNISHYRVDIISDAYGLRYVVEGVPFALSFLVVMLIIFFQPKIECNNKIILILYIYIITKLTLLCKDGLKIFFGRYWPKTWLHHNLSLIHDGVYGFHYLHGYGNLGSFPSGHVAFVSIICFTLMIIYPQLKKLWLGIILIMVSLLILLNYHFLGDCLAAVALSIFFAYFGFSIYSYVYNTIAQKFFFSTN